MTARIDAPIVERRTIGHDGTAIAYYLAGEGPNVWVVPPGIATPLLTWKNVIEHLHHRWTLVVVDPRGTYHSAMPADPWAVGVEEHALDVRAVVEAEGLDRYVVGGWSMGVQVSLEYYRRYPESVLGLILINGSYGDLLSTVLPIPHSGILLEGFLRGSLAVFGRALTPLLRTAIFEIMSPDTWRSMDLLVGGGELLDELWQVLKTLDFQVYLRTLVRAHHHTAADLLPRIAVPTLITAGDNDRMTPVSIAYRMHQAIPDSELLIAKRGTHYGLVEFPELYNQTLSRFLQRFE